MRSNSRLLFASAATGAALCGLIGALLGAVAGSGTSILLPGLGLVISGSLALGIVCGLSGAVVGSALGLLTASIIILKRRRDYP